MHANISSKLKPDQYILMFNCSLFLLLLFSSFSPSFLGVGGGGGSEGNFSLGKVAYPEKSHSHKFCIVIIGFLLTFMCLDLFKKKSI